MRNIYFGRQLLGLVIVVGLLLLGACASAPTSKPAPTTTSTPTPTPTLTPTITPTPTLTPTITPTPTLTPTITPTPTPTTSLTPGPGVTVDLTAQSFSFDKRTITVTAGASVTINFNNKDSGVPHNFALYTNSSGSTSIFVGQRITGPATTVYKFTAPATAGTYFFRCDIHPTTMTGSFIVTAP